MTLVTTADVIVHCEEEATISTPIPKSLNRLKAVPLSPGLSLPCKSVCQSNGITYALHQYGRLETIDKDYKLDVFVPFIYSQLFRPPGSIASITVHNDRMYTLLNDDDDHSWTAKVLDLAGGLINEWRLPDSEYSNKIALVGDRVIISERRSRQLSVYSPSGDLLRQIPCPLYDEYEVYLCAVGTDSVIVSYPGSSLVFRVDVTTGSIRWACKTVNQPQGVTSYGQDYVLVSSHGSDSIKILSAKTGEGSLSVTS